MLAELRVQDLGVIGTLEVVFGPGLTVVSGETGAGKTLVVEAIELLLGGRAEGSVVRAGAREAIVEGRFVSGDDETVLCRVVPVSGRSRAYVNGRMAPVSVLEDNGRRLVDLHGQHAHQSLLRPAHQRAALDRFAKIDRSRLVQVRREIAGLQERLAALGGDDRQRRRELDLLCFELEEIEAARISSADEDDELAAEEEALASVAALREALGSAVLALSGSAVDASDGAQGCLGAAITALGRHNPLKAHAERLKGLQGELQDALSGLRLAREGLEDDPARLEAVRARRQLLRGLVRKHGEHLGDVLEAARAHRRRIAELEGEETSRAGIEAELAALRAELARQEVAIGDQRRASAPMLARAVEARLSELGLGDARLAVRVAPEGLGDDMELVFSANVGEPLAPLRQIASGGELARTMLALRLVLSTGPATLVFDEVDAGIGGKAAVAVGQALAELGRSSQVLVVTHLAQVAARADAHFVVEKVVQGGRTLTEVRPVEGEARIAELSRMLAGDPDSPAGRRHAKALVEEVARRPGSVRRSGRRAL
jgi:DNA repair protein RecN (Recombination protein N)